jgi:hypothetical protein
MNDDSERLRPITGGPADYVFDLRISSSATVCAHRGRIFGGADGWRCADCRVTVGSVQARRKNPEVES